MNLFSFWSKVLEVIKKEDEPYYAQFSQNVFPISYENGVFTIVLSAQAPWIVGWFNTVYKRKLIKIMNELSNEPVQLVVNVEQASQPAAPAPAPKAEPAPAPAPFPEAAPKASMPAPDVPPMPTAETETATEPAPAPFPETAPKAAIPDLIQNVAKGNYTNAALPDINDVMKKTTLEPTNLFEPVQPAKKSTFEDQININEHFTFETFIHGPSNELAFQAAKSVAEAAISGKTDRKTNPLFIYGPSGLGKTHLLHAICNYINEKAPQLNVRFITSETFLNDLIKSISNGTMEQFRNRYRKVDYFLMDDVQLFSGKDSSQTEIFNTFNVLFDNNKHIILTSDRTPQDIEKLEDRIKTRFSSGLIAPIDPPDYEMCSVILSKKAEADKIRLPEDVINYIAGHIHTNVRELNGAYNKLVSYCQFTKKEIDMETARMALKDVIPMDGKKQLSMDIITDEVCKYYGVSKAGVFSSGRPKHLVLPRQMAMYFCRHLLNESYPNIRDFFKRKDHSTVLYACKRVEKEIKKGDDIAKAYNVLKERLNNL